MQTDSDSGTTTSVLMDEDVFMYECRWKTALPFSKSINVAGDKDYLFRRTSPLWNCFSFPREGT